MPNVFFTADTHFCDEKAWKEGYDKKTLTEFKSVEERDETIIERWNKVVKPGDKVYHAGDVGFDKRRLALILPRLHGRKRLILGNHDHLDRFPCLMENFSKVALIRDFGTFVVSHMPIMESLLKSHQICVHGHTHRQKARTPRYLNICTENTDYTPISLDAIIAYIKE